MPHYLPRTIFETLLAQTVGIPGYIGRSSRRKLRRRFGKRSLSEFESILKKLSKDDIVLDLGANIGEITAQLASTGAKVHAYEPDPLTFSLLDERFREFNNVVTHNKAVGAKTGSARLRRMKGVADPSKWRAASEGASIRYTDQRMNLGDSVDVEILSFMDIVNSHEKRIKLIKMDIEGAEWDILDTIFSMPEPFNFEYLFVETHEMLELDKIPLVDEYRLRSSGFSHSYVDLYWP